DRQKSYADLKRNPMEFEVEDGVMLKVSPWKGIKCYADEPLVMPLEGIHVDDKLQFVEEPVEIMEREIKRLKRSRIPLVKVCWNSRRGSEFTWEREDSFKQKYPQLFTNRALSSTTRSIFEDKALLTGGDLTLPDSLFARPDLGCLQIGSEPVIYEPSTTFTCRCNPKYLAPSDDEAPLEDQPLSIDASPTALSPGYVVDSDPEEDSEEDPEEDHADYPIDRGDDDDDTDNEDEEPFEDEDDDEEEEEHLALADSSTVPVVDPVPSAGDTEAFETDESAPTPRSPQTKVPFA
ncbi:hypothetical protein Tco_0788491, partial [Tanacetum coccineum]